MGDFASCFDVDVVCYKFCWEVFLFIETKYQQCGFQPYEVNKFNTFWGWGTVAVIFPYLTVGGDYAIPMDNNATLNLSAGLILAVFVPSPYVGVSYCW